MATGPPETRMSLIVRLQNSDDIKAWEDFINLYSPVLFRVARSRKLQMADAENLVQEVFLAVARSITQWLKRDNRGRFHAWLLTVARNEATDILTRRTKRPLFQDPNLPSSSIEKLPAPEEIAGQLNLEYRRSVFQWAAEKVRAKVAPATWNAFWLTHIEGLSVDQAAKTLNTRPANIYFGRSRVMARIKELVALYEEQS